MKQKLKLFSTLMIVCCLLLAAPSSAQAIPPLPSSLYGTVKVNDANVTDGTLIEAQINGTVFAQAYTQTYQGDSVYSLDIPGDETGTTAVEGGKEGDSVTFKVGGVAAIETATWHSGTNVELNLTSASSTPVSPPQKTPTHVPTQTAIVVPPTATNKVVPSQASTQTDTSVPILTSITATPNIPVVSGATTSTPAKTAVVESPGGDSSSPSLVILIVFLLLALIAIGFLILRRNKGLK